jgi:hypothetical protein
MIRCGLHGKKRHGYIVCRHIVKDGAAHVVAPSSGSADPSSDLGEALCAACAADDEGLLTDDLMIVCDRCLTRILARHH